MLVFLGIGFGILFVQRDHVVKRDVAWEDRPLSVEPGGVEV